LKDVPRRGVDDVPTPLVGCTAGAPGNEIESVIHDIDHAYLASIWAFTEHADRNEAESDALRDEHQLDVVPIDLDRDPQRSIGLRESAQQRIAETASFGIQDPTVIGKSREPSTGQAGGLLGDTHQPVMTQLNARDVGGQRRAFGKKRHRKVERSVAQRLDQLPTPPRREPNGEARELPAQFSDRAARDHLGHRLRQPEPKIPARSLGIIHDIAQALECPDQRLPLTEGDFALTRETRRAHSPVEKRDAERLLQALDAPRNRGLREMKLPRGAIDGASLGRDQECA
jgi:hypothetical protein